MAGSPLVGTGAVGGARGTAAGALRILMEFVTQFNDSEFNQVQQRLAQLATQQASAEASLVQRVKARQDLQDKYDRGQRIIAAEQKRLTADPANQAANDLAIRFKDQITQLGKLDVELDKIANKRGPLSRQEIADRNALNGAQRTLLNQIAREHNLDVEAVALGARKLRTERELAAAADQVRIAEERTGNIQRQQVVEGEKLTRLQKVRKDFLPKLGSLATGAIGGILGGALFGAGFDLAQKAIDGVTEQLQDIVDPARHAREALDGVAKSIEAIVSQDHLTKLEAAGKFVQGFGFGREVLGPQNRVERMLALAASTQALKDKIATLGTTLDQVSHGTELWDKQVEDLRTKVYAANPVLTEISDKIKRFATLSPSNPMSLLDPKDLDRFNAAQKESELIVQEIVKSVALTNEWAGHAQEVADAFNSIRLEKVLAQINEIKEALIEAADAARKVRVDNIEAGLKTTLDNLDTAQSQHEDAVTIAADARIQRLRDQMDAIQSVPSPRTKNIKDAMDALGNAGPSARTLALAAAIERLNAAEERRGYLQSLNDIKEQRHLLILTRQLSLAKQRINIDDYGGKGRVIAIDAEIARLNKQSEAQDKLNALIDLQYRASQRVARSEGETIQDYLTRRAQEYRKLLTEQSQMDQQNRVDALEKAKAATQFNIDLKELEAQRAELIRKHDLEAQLKHLEDLKKASEEADRAAQEAQREHLQKQLEISQKADDAVADAQKAAIQKQIDRIENETKREIEDSRKKNEILKQQAKDNADAAKAAADKRYEEEKKKAEDAAAIAVGLANDTENKKLGLAMEGAKTLADLNLVAGNLAGSSLAYAQLQSSIEGLGMPDWLTSETLAHAESLRQMYLAQFHKLDDARVGSNYGGRGQAKGGVFPLTNAMNFGNNMRVGEEGTELGIVLSNRVTAALKNSQGGGPAIGTLNIYSYENPKDAEYRQRQVIRDEVMRSF